MSDAVYDIGFNAEVRSGARRLHVQTEIVGRSELKIRTIVVEGGAILANYDQPCPPDEGVEQIRRLAHTHHQNCVDRTARGEGI